MVRQADCPKMMPMYDSKTDLFYKVGPRGGIKSSKSPYGKYNRASANSITVDFEAKIKHLSGICKTGSMDDLLRDNFVIREGKDLYSFGPKGGISVLKHGKKKWSPISAKRAPTRVKEQSERAKEIIALTNKAIKEARWEKELQIYLAQHTHVQQLTDMVPRQYIVDNIYYNEADRKLYSPSTKTGKLVKLKMNKASDDVKQAYGTLMAQEFMRVWKIQHNGSYEGAVMDAKQPYMVVKKGPFGTPFYYRDFSKNKGFSKVNDQVKETLSQSTLSVMDKWKPVERKVKKAKPNYNEYQLDPRLLDDRKTMNNQSAYTPPPFIPKQEPIIPTSREELREEFELDDLINQMAG